MPPLLFVLLCQPENLGLGFPFFQVDKVFLDLQPPAESSEASIRADDSMAWDDDSDRIFPQRLTNASVTFVVKLVGDCLVENSVTMRNFSSFYPDPFLIRCSR